MPARHISSQSFDEILSDLGDDPAIPDPHGIRRAPSQKSTPPRPPSQSKGNHFSESLSHIQIKDFAHAYAGPIIIFGVLVAAAGAFFMAYQTLNNHSQGTLEESQKQITELKKEIALMREEIHQDQDDLYGEIDELEVSVHLLKEKKPEMRTSSKPLTPPHELELRRWRYLGSSQMGATQQAYFHNGKNHLVFERGSQVLGDWRLSTIEKEQATITHPQGKFLVLKAIKSQ